MSPPQTSSPNKGVFKSSAAPTSCGLTRLRAGVYNAPDVPSTFYEAILEYLKTALNLSYTSLIYESTEDNTCAQIENHEVDIGKCIIYKYLFIHIFQNLAWVSYQKYFELVEAKKVARLLPASTVHSHPKNNLESGESFGLFSDVVVHSSLK